MVLLLTGEDWGWCDGRAVLLDYSGIGIDFNTEVGIKNSKEGKEVISSLEMLGREERQNDKIINNKLEDITSDSPYTTNT